VKDVKMPPAPAALEVRTVIERLRSFLSGSALVGRAKFGVVAVWPPPEEGQGVEIPEDADLVDGGYIDSIGLMDLVSFVESEFRVVVGNDELRHENLGTLGACARFVLHKLEGGRVE
jgi:acyl carrier protein